MNSRAKLPGIVSARLKREQYEVNFSDLEPPLTQHEAQIEAERCYFCYDAPCVTACPTGIDIPLFIRQIASGTPDAAAQTIFDSNILGGMCARSCPTEVLCEEACVRETSEGKPVLIGQLQRHATDGLMAKADHPYARMPETGKRVAVIGSGPAGLACAHRLAVYGHFVDIFEKREFLGGLNQTGIATYKTVENFAQKEIEWLLRIGGINVKTNRSITSIEQLQQLQNDYDAVFLGIGLGDVNKLELGDEIASNAVDFIEQLRLCNDYSTIPVGNDVVVIGGGMTAIDAAVQSKKLGASNVTLLYRRSRSEMGASDHEVELALVSGVKLIANALPTAVEGKSQTKQVKLAHTQMFNGRLELSEEEKVLDTDQILVAIGQKLDCDIETLVVVKGRIAVDERGRTSVSGLWAGGDCTNQGKDLTVTAVAQGRDAAEDIHRCLT